MQRRDFVMALGLAAVWPLQVQAEQPKKVPRIGFIVIGASANLNAFLQELRELGYVDGQNIAVEVRAVNEIERFRLWPANWLVLRSMSSSQEARSPAVLHSKRPPRSRSLS